MNKKDTQEDYYKFSLSFEGKLVEDSVDAFDVANTILAISQVLQEIGEIRFGSEAVKNIRININAFKGGSLLTDFLIFLSQAKEKTTPLISGGGAYKVGKNILDVLKTYIDIKKLLKGKKPKKIEALDRNNIKITAQDNAVININNYDFRALQSKTLSKNVAKAVSPLTKSDSLLEEIKLTEGKKEIVVIDKKESLYLESVEDLQVLSEIKYKGVITKIDTKAYSGYINIDKRRLPFNYDKSIKQQKFDILVESLRRKIQIYLIGEVKMDYESNPLHMQVRDVESDIKLFD